MFVPDPLVYDAGASMVPVSRRRTGVPVTMTEVLKVIEIATVVGSV